MKLATLDPSVSIEIENTKLRCIKKIEKAII